MAKGGYVGVSGVARKIKKGYIGVDNISRKIKKAYMGVGGVARPCWGGGDVVYYGTITPLSEAKTNLAGGTIGDYALFAGGTTGTSGRRSSTVEVYSDTLVKSSAADLSAARYNLASANAGDYLLFAGGSGNRGTNTVDYYTSSLTKGTAAPLPATITKGVGTKLGEYAFILGSRDVVCVYNSGLTMTELPGMSIPRVSDGTASVGDYVLIVGGSSGTRRLNTVEVYSNNLTKLNNLTIPIATTSLTGCGAATGNYALFAGGDDGTAVAIGHMTATVNCFNASLTLLTSPSLSVAKALLGATSIEDTIIFAGGWDQTAYAPVNTVDVYTDSLTRQSPPPNNLSIARLYMGCATVGQYGIFASGGQTGLNALTANVDVYTL